MDVVGVMPDMSTGGLPVACENFVSTIILPSQARFTSLGAKSDQSLQQQPAPSSFLRTCPVQVVAQS